MKFKEFLNESTDAKSLLVDLQNLFIDRYNIRPVDCQWTTDHPTSRPCLVVRFIGHWQQDPDSMTDDTADDDTTSHVPDDANSQDIATLVRQFERHYNCKIEIKNPSSRVYWFMCAQQ